MADVTCKIEDCEKPKKRGARGWCGMHYMRWYKYGDPLFAKIFFGTPEERFWHFLDKRGPDECWPWTGTITKQGYGQLATGGSASTAAHLFAYKLLTGEVPTGFQVDHTCHNPAICAPGVSCPHRRCCNPAHLEAVTQFVNTMRSGAVPAVNARKDFCLRGHEFTEDNTGWSVNRSPGGTARRSRYCRECRREQEPTPEQRARRAATQRARYAKKRAGRPSGRALKTHCGKGHEFTEENTYRYQGKRRCKECAREENRTRKRKARAAAKLESANIQPGTS